VTQLGPVLTRLDGMSKKLEVDLPPLVTNANKFLVDGDAVVANFNTPESRERLDRCSTAARLLGEPEGRQHEREGSDRDARRQAVARFLGGPTVLPPSEDDILKSNKVLRLKQDVDVNAARLPRAPNRTQRTDRRIGLVVFYSSYQFVG